MLSGFRARGMLAVIASLVFARLKQIHSTSERLVDYATNIRWTDHWSRSTVVDGVAARSIDRFCKMGGCCAMTAIRIVGRTLVLSILLLWLGSAHAQDIRIAVVGSMTGPLAESGDENKRGAELAAKDINAAGGVNG